MSADTSDLILRNDHLEVVITPSKGADVYAVIDRATGIDVLFKTPWGRHDPRAGEPPYGGSQAGWLARYAGGWQMLLPHAGPERQYADVLRGFHGEAAIVPWNVNRSSATSAVLGVDLFTVPFQVTRDIRLDGPALHVTDTVVNCSTVPVEYMWVQHPAFGPPFAGPACKIDSGARRLITDADAPGTALGPNLTMPIDDVRTTAGESFDLASLPGPDSRREIFAALIDFDDGWFTLTNHELGFGIRMDWDTATFPYAWFWQECHATAGFPWFGRAYAVAIEPANVLPGTGEAGDGLRRGDPAILEPACSRSARLTLTRFGAPVTGED
ncbi:MAG: DUF4432 family protein [Microlunatus sp.]|nr:DUF4432 family protein [Microlunatus sp.]